MTGCSARRSRLPIGPPCLSGRRRTSPSANPSARWEELFSEHRTVLLEGAGHYIEEDAPEEIVAAIRDWSAN